MADSNKGMKVGGLGSIRENDDEIAEVVKQIKPEFETRSDKKFESIEVISYKRQTVAGTNYFVKVSNSKFYLSSKYFDHFWDQNLPNSR